MYGPIIEDKFAEFQNEWADQRPGTAEHLATSLSAGREL
jgi:hypothetical protein